MTALRLFMLAMMSPAVIACGVEEADPLTPDRPPANVGKGDAICPSVPVGIAPVSTPPRICLAPHELPVAIQAEINEFWGSSVEVCRCGPDSAEDCEMNAFSLFGLGWIYYDPALLAQLQQSGSTMPAYWLLAHEFGHEIEGRFEKSPIELARELSADCYGGYFLGSLVCQGRVAQVDLATTIRIACQIGDGEHWLDLDSHGTCEQRVEAMLAGLEAYLAGKSALDSCRL